MQSNRYLFSRAKLAAQILLFSARNSCFCVLLIIALGDKASSATQSDDVAKARKGQKYQGSVDISVSTVTDSGVVNLTILGQGTSGDHKGDVFFSLDESVRVRETPSGLQLETVGIHTSPEN